VNGGSWGSRACVEQNEAMEAIDKLRDALRAAENAATIKIISDFKKGGMTDDKLVAKIKDNHATTRDYMSALNRISSRINA
jgi:hypothetical protein